MSKYTAEQVIEAAASVDAAWCKSDPLVRAPRCHKAAEMLREYAALLTKLETCNDSAGYTNGPISDGGMDPRDRESGKKPKTWPVGARETCLAKARELLKKGSVKPEAKE